ncbi:MAG TPA: hypothetical protein VIJ50_11415 [Solirubrobacteraceae bacterium]
MVNDPEPRKAANEFTYTNHRTVQAADQIGAAVLSDSASDAFATEIDAAEKSRGRS